MADDHWPDRDFQFVPDDYAHALGMMAVYYNNAETILFKLAHILLTDGVATRDVINHHLHNKARLDLLRAIARELPPDERECVLHAVHCFDICSDNRNILMHAVLVTSSDPTDDLEARKRHSSRPGLEVKFEMPLSRLRKAADQTQDTLFFLMHLWGYFVAKIVPREFVRPGARLPTLPEKSPKPDKLNSRQPPQDQAGK